MAHSFDNSITNQVLTLQTPMTSGIPPQTTLSSTCSPAVTSLQDGVPNSYYRSRPLSHSGSPHAASYGCEPGPSIQNTEAITASHNLNDLFKAMCMTEQEASQYQQLCVRLMGWPHIHRIVIIIITRKLYLSPQRRLVTLTKLLKKFVMPVPNGYDGSLAC